MLHTLPNIDFIVMSNYHPDADPQFVAMHSHYKQQSSRLMNALFQSATEINPYSPLLDSELLEFCYHLWGEGFKIVPVSNPDIDRD